MCTIYTWHIPQAGVLWVAKKHRNLVDFSGISGVFSILLWATHNAKCAHTRKNTQCANANAQRFGQKTWTSAISRHAVCAPNYNAVISPAAKQTKPILCLRLSPLHCAVEIDNSERNPNPGLFAGQFSISIFISLLYLVILLFALMVTLVWEKKTGRMKVLQTSLRAAGGSYRFLVWPKSTDEKNIFSKKKKTEKETGGESIFNKSTCSECTTLWVFSPGSHHFFSIFGVFFPYTSINSFRCQNICSVFGARYISSSVD